MEYTIHNIKEKPNLNLRMATWFHEIWHLPLTVYLNSIEECLIDTTLVPQWYMIMIGGLGVIDNDFHNRIDLSPNIYAVYIEERYRCKGLAGKLLNYVCHDM